MCACLVLAGLSSLSGWYRIKYEVLFLVAIGLDPGNVDLYLEQFGCL